MEPSTTLPGSFPTVPHDAKISDPVMARELLERIKALDQDNPDQPERLYLPAVVEIRSLFQIRGDDGRNDKHVEDLFDCLKRSGDLKPITVWRCGGTAVLIDGHHRLYAYRRLARKSPDPVSIPVEWFGGSVDEAIAKAAESNSEIKLSLTAEQRGNFAWRLVVLGAHSKSETAKLSGIAERTVANMRSAKRALEQVNIELPKTWREAMRLAKGRELPEIDYEEYMEQQAKEWADRLASEFSTTMARKPELAAKALERYFGRQLTTLVKELLVILDEDPRDTDEADELDAQADF